MEYEGKFWNVPESSGMFRKVMECSGRSWNVPEGHGISWNIQELARTF